MIRLINTVLHYVRKNTDEFVFYYFMRKFALFYVQKAS
jgi:hypothetical protein